MGGTTLTVSVVGVAVPFDGCEFVHADEGAEAAAVSSTLLVRKGVPRLSSGDEFFDSGGAVGNRSARPKAATAARVTDRLLLPRLSDHATHAVVVAVAVAAPPRVGRVAAAADGRGSSAKRTLRRSSAAEPAWRTSDAEGKVGAAVKDDDGCAGTAGEVSAAVAAPDKGMRWRLPRPLPTPPPPVPAVAAVRRLTPKGASCTYG